MSDYKWPQRKTQGVQPWALWAIIIAALAVSAIMGII